MSGKRLLDAALLFNATRKIARQHIKLRSEQFEVWNKTSTVAKAVRNQTDRVTLTAQAAAVLARRLNDEAPAWTKNTVETRRTDSANPVPSSESVDQSKGDQTQREGLAQDHHYERSQQNAAQQPAPASEINVQQRKPARYPTPDGTIPPSGTPVDVSAGAEGTSVDGERGAAPPIKEPLVQEQEQRPASIQPESSGASTIPDSRAGAPDAIPHKETVPEQEAVPEDVNTDVFHSPRVSKLLGNKKQEEQAHEDAKKDKTSSVTDAQVVSSSVSEPNTSRTVHTQADDAADEDVKNLASSIADDADATPQASDEPIQSPTREYSMHESRVPSSRVGRLWEYSGLATSMAFGAVGETFRRATGGNAGAGGSLMLSAGNMERLVKKLSKMRGAALKLGQMMSFQDSKMLPAPIHEVLQRVQDNADYMPPSQRNSVLASNLGSDWSTLFSHFEDQPIAAASIGQVHRATLASTGESVAVKIQYPGVATSISSDLNNLSILLTASRLLPKGLYLDKTIANARTELAWECNYLREATCQTRFRSLLASSTSTFTVPRIIPEASGPQVLTAEFMHGTAVTKPALNLTQPQRDWLGTQILRLCLRELTEFNFMQTDPNWTNFLFNPRTSKIELLDFGAAREFPPRFVDPYVSLLIAASRSDHALVRDLSVQLGYLTGRESKAMLDAHVSSILTLSEPFSASASSSAEQDAGVYDFRDQTITDRVRALIPVMLRERLAPPPEETYSLHRKLSGAFLLLARLGSRVRCREMFVSATGEWERRRGGKGGEGSVSETD
ncbi:MAG: hypothetical protein M1828_005681 [Chrysothrix sp. TS-e1954]|nr:MAG: hypothetical protein M1828_005681 [Chrysothrix sp. TS-e1954]